MIISIKDFGPYACSGETPIREVLKRIDVSPYLFQVVLDEHGRLQGTVTDGDIRRAILQGVSLEDSARACMQTEPHTGRFGDPQFNRVKLSNLGSTRTFLPVLDDGGTVREILVLATGEGIGSALIMAGGPGTRLGERTRNTPKTLLPVGDRPILEHIVGALEAAGVEDIIISVHYLADQIRDFVAARDNSARIQLLEEPERLGTAGALGLLGDLARNESLLVINGDVLTRIDFAALHDFHQRHGFDGTLAVARYDVEIPYGVIRYGKEGVFESIDEKPRVTNFIAAGVYYLSRKYIELVPPGASMDMPELLNRGREMGLMTGLFPIHEYWTDVGRPDELEAAQVFHSVSK